MRSLISLLWYLWPLYYVGTKPKPSSMTSLNPLINLYIYISTKKKKNHTIDPSNYVLWRHWPPYIFYLRSLRRGMGQNINYDFLQMVEEYRAKIPVSIPPHPFPSHPFPSLLFYSLPLPSSHYDVTTSIMTPLVTLLTPSITLLLWRQLPFYFLFS